MSRAGRLEIKLRWLFNNFRDHAFTTTDLCAECYPDAEWYPVRRQRVAVLRAAEAVLDGDPDWRVSRLDAHDAHGRERVFYNAASARSTALVRAWSYGIRDYRGSEPNATQIANAALEVAEHVAIRDAATPEEAARLKAGFETKREAELAALAVELKATFQGFRKLSKSEAQNSDNLRERRIAAADAKMMLAMVQQALAENNPDAMRSVLTELEDMIRFMEVKGH